MTNAVEMVEAVGGIVQEVAVTGVGLVFGIIGILIAIWAAKWAYRKLRASAS